MHLPLMGPGRKKPRDGEIQGKTGRTAPGPYKRRKKGEYHMPEDPIHFNAYAKRPEATHQKAVKYLNWWIREFGEAREVVTSAPWKVGL